MLTGVLRQTSESFKKRGFRRTVQILLSIAGDWYFDFKFGTETTRWVELENLRLESRNKKHGEKYLPTGERPFSELMELLRFPNDSVFVDLGSGKGRVLLMASHYNFKKVVGIEFSKYLCEVARRNIRKYNRKRPLGTEIEIIEADVADYAVREDENIFFLFNPFDQVVMRKVLDRLKTSIIKAPRRVWIIYHNPVCSKIFEEDGDFNSCGHYIISGSEFRVYSNNL